MRDAFLIILYGLIMVTGCSSVEQRRALEKEFARMSGVERARMGTNFFRDAGISCPEGLHNAFASRSYECLSVRMKIDRFCLTLK